MGLMLFVCSLVYLPQYIPHINLAYTWVSKNIIQIYKFPSTQNSISSKSRTHTLQKKKEKIKSRTMPADTTSFNKYFLSVASREKPLYIIHYNIYNPNKTKKKRQRWNRNNEKFSSTAIARSLSIYLLLLHTWVFQTQMVPLSITKNPNQKQNEQNSLQKKDREK